MQKIRIGLIILAMLLVVVPAAAQGGTLAYGSSVTVSLTAESPLGFYTFAGTAGDRVTVYAVGITPGMTPSVSLLDPAQTQLATNGACPFAGGNAGIACVSYRLVQSGNYSVLVSNSAGQPGDLLLRLDGVPSAASPVVTPDVTTEISFPPGAAATTFSFNADPTVPLSLDMSTNSPAFAFTAMLFDPMGQLAGVWAGSTITGVNTSVMPGAGLYEVTVQALLPQMQGVVTILLSTGAPSAPGTLPTAAPPTQSALPTTCQVTSGSLNVNVRRGPGTNYPIITSLLAGTSADVTGQSTDGTWFVVTVNGIRGWVAASVTTLGGPCGSLPVIQAPPTPTPGPTDIPPTAPPAPAISFTVDGGPSASVTPGGCATVAWNVSNVTAVYYEGAGVAGSGSSMECPPSTKTYTLDVALNDGTTAQRTVTIVVAASGPDLIISEFSLNPSTPVRGNPVDVRVGVYNQGSASISSTSFHIEWYPGEGYPSPACTWDLTDMSAGGGRILTCTYAGYPSHYPSINTKVVVDTANTITESNEGNNVHLEAVTVTAP